MNEDPNFGTNTNILRGFPGPILLFPSRRKWLGMIAGSAGFVIASIFIAGSNPIAALMGLLFFGACLLVGIVVLLPGSASLQLDKSGFVCTRFFRTTAYRWNEVSDFDVWRFRTTKIVMFEVAKPHLTTLEKINRRLTGRNKGLPDTFGLTAEDLVELMTGWRNMATAKNR
jgi:hypothetical protein